MRAMNAIPTPLPVSEPMPIAAGGQPRRVTHGVHVGKVQLGGGAPVVVQSMTNTDTADVAASVKQVAELWRAGSELVRLTVNTPRPPRPSRASSTSWR